jgi:hypothetical protein
MENLINGPNWYEGMGAPSPLMWQIATGTTITAAAPFAVIPFVFQSEGAQWLTSDPINCQKPDGQVKTVINFFYVRNDSLYFISEI